MLLNMILFGTFTMTLVLHMHSFMKTSRKSELKLRLLHNLQYSVDLQKVNQNIDFPLNK